jgi:hypothetical protein
VQLSARTRVSPLSLSTAILAVVFALTGVANFVLNVWIVTAPFGTDLFNAQVARVNAITRVALTIPELAGWGAAMWMVFSALYAPLPEMPGKKDFWELVEEREAKDREATVS